MGEEVDVEEGAIAAAFKKMASEELEKLYPVKATAEAYQLPMLPLIADFQQTLVGIQASTSDDCVRILAETGDIFHDHRDRIKKVRALLDDATINLIKDARAVVYELGPKLISHPLFAEVGDSLKALRTLLQSDQLLDQIDSVATHTQAVARVYRSIYCDIFDRRREAYLKAIEDLKTRAEWTMLSAEAADALLAPLQTRLGDEADRQRVAEGASLGNATLAEMESDLAAVDALKASVLAQLHKETMTKVGPLSLVLCHRQGISHHGPRTLDQGRRTKDRSHGNR